MEFVFFSVVGLTALYVGYMLMLVVREYYERKRLSKRFEKEVEDEE